MTAAVATEHVVPGVGYLTLPRPEQRFSGQRGQQPDASITECAALPVDAPERARFRWVLGHQAAFCVWRLLADLLRSELLRPGTAETSLTIAARLVDAYSVLLLYTGSCSTEIYHSTIRPEMCAAHPAFSGKWARDYELIPTLIGAVRSAFPEQAQALAGSARTNQIVHMAVADKLVPQGQSLLREARGAGPITTSDAERDLFDRFFLVHRRPISKHALISQLDERLERIAADLMVAPLPAPGHVRHNTEPITRLHRDSGEILTEITKWLREIGADSHPTRKGKHGRVQEHCGERADRRLYP